MHKIAVVGVGLLWSNLIFFLNVSHLEMCTGLFLDRKDLIVDGYTYAYSSDRIKFQGK